MSFSKYSNNLVLISNVLIFFSSYIFCTLSEADLDNLVSVIAVLLPASLIALLLRSKGILIDEINEKHYANLGKVLFAFTVFWAYIGGFQYYIIWYGNLPEEIYWFMQRWEGSWKYLSIFLIFGHFVIPRAGLPH